eukprot:CAMPEP_0197249334 /NCGR_PEP_ID=MMETSP1429-20130617/46583_1 /TAXON_ID=49237 /ORGANISM="Chaetoceros  sp., Strain UNC1202" /LENGTH=50 /DNA_ID=CAMNT_0042710823 /DNA_START=11 /DNA_END=159 /DNA_ORIENTATION=-
MSLRNTEGEERNKEEDEESKPQELQTRIPPVSPERKKIRNINELYEYLKV